MTTMNLFTKQIPLIFNIVGFQTVWFLCVYGAARSNVLPGIVAAVIFAVVSLLFSKHKKYDLMTLCLAMPIGFVMDSVLAQSKVISFSHPLPDANWAPLWIMCLWLGFALTLNHSLKSIYTKPWRILLFGFFGAPIAYSIASYKFGAMTFHGNMMIALLFIACIWGLGLSLLYFLNHRIRPFNQEYIPQ